MTIKMTPVESSNIVAVGYLPADELLVIDFKSGGRYTYADVAPEEYEALLGAESIGSYFARCIKPYHFGGRVVGS